MSCSWIGYNVGGCLLLVWLLLSDNFGVGVLMGGVRGGGKCSIGFIVGICLFNVFCDTYVLRYASRS